MSRVRFIPACAILSIGTPLPPRVAFYGRRALYGRRINGKTGAARGSSTDPLWGTADSLFGGLVNPPSVVAVVKFTGLE